MAAGRSRPRAGSPRQGGDPAVAVTAKAGGEPDDGGGQGRLVVRRLRSPALGGAMLAENPAGQAFGHAMLGDDALHAGAAAGGAQKFPAAASWRISFSSVRSDTARRSRVSSASSSFSRFT